MYKAVLFPDPYLPEIRDVIMKESPEDLIQAVVEYLKRDPCGFILFKHDGKRYRELPRIYYYYVNHKLGRVG